MNSYLIDNSVWQRVGQPAVRQAVDHLLDDLSPTSVLMCPPVAAEVGFSARSGADHDAIQGWLMAFPECPITPSTARVLHLQNTLFNSGLFRAVGATDTLVACYALVNDATVLHYDRDFEYVARVSPDFRHRWIAPSGSLDGHPDAN